MTSDVHELHTTSVTTPSDTVIRMERTFDAPRELVWKAHTDPELMAQWLGPNDVTITIEEMDVRPGGSYRYTARREGEEFGFSGEYREVDPPKVLEATFVFSGWDSTSVDRMELEELEGGRTRLVSTSTFDSQEERDGKLQSGMKRGVDDGYDKLDELLAAR